MEIFVVMMTLTYIWHDCFVVETERCRVVFDFWKDELGQLSEILSGEDKPLYFFVSHHHKDHFNREIFLWAKRLRKVHYILSKDTARSIHYMLKEGSTYQGEYRVDKSMVTVLKPGESFTTDDLCVNAFGSTDIGNSYMLEIEGYKIFHAGDLNAWVWKDESTEAEIAAAMRDFREKLLPLEAITKELDLAMFPVDSRIGRDYWEGASMFVRMFAVRHFVPMHFELGETVVEVEKYHADAVRFDLYANNNFGMYHSLSVPGDSLRL